MTKKYVYLDPDNYFDQAEACHAYLIMWHEGQWSKKYELLSRSEFKPGPSWSEEVVEEMNEYYHEFSTMSDDAIEMFMNELDEYLESTKDE